MLLTRDNLLCRLRGHLRTSQKVDIAVAWATPCDALEHFCQFAKLRGAVTVRAVVGVCGNATHPNALRSIMECAQLRIATGSLFHPKFYLFHQKEHRIGWIGSPNLTCNGFEQNEELAFEFLDEEAQASRWFEDRWNSLRDEASKKLLKEYEENWTPPPPTPRTPKPHTPKPDASFYDIVGSVTDWPSFVAAIDKADAYWEFRTEAWEFPFTVTREYDSWLRTIMLGRDVARRENWSRLSEEDRHLLMGTKHPYGLLGSMRGAGTAQKVFREASPQNRAIRRTIRGGLQPVIEANDAHFAEAACEFIAEVEKIPGFAGGISTRLLTLARPDRAISVNNGSRRWLSELTGLPKTSLSHVPRGRTRSYMDLLRWFEEREWYSHPKPRNARERTLANTRAALVDALVYEE
jgi:HKD family nuclease